MSVADTDALVNLFARKFREGRFSAMTMLVDLCVLGQPPKKSSIIKNANDSVVVILDEEPQKLGCCASVC